MKRSCFLLHECQDYAGCTKYNNLMPKKVFQLKNKMVSLKNDMKSEKDVSWIFIFFLRSQTKEFIAKRESTTPTRGVYKHHSIGMIDRSIVN